MPVRNIPKTVGAGGFAISSNSGLIEAISLLHQVPKKMEKFSQQAAAANVGHVVRKARENFETSIIRTSSKGDRPVDRETGNFTFGVRSGGSMVGRTFTTGKTGHGFGFVDIAKADAQTNFVWRSLEHGLSGTVFSPSSLGLFKLYPLGEHILPKYYGFDAPKPGGRLLLGQFASLRMPFRRAVRDTDRFGEGFAGKHFVEQAWLDSYQFIERKYKQAVDQAMGVIKKVV